ncbi:MAG: hypothetical protein ACPLXP_01820 [Microgenomates group bacterium]
MIDSAQLLLIVVVTILTILLTAVGIQGFFILKEVRRSVEKMNKILDDAGTISESVAKPISSLSSSLSGLSGIAGLLGWLITKTKREKEKKDE